ncbi:MAG TPA: response regulator [Cytophagales bacterium]|nr:response regulator [Cytophagales bacterium]
MTKPLSENKVSFEHHRRLRLIYLFSFLAILSTLPYIFIFSGELSFLSPVSIGAIAIFISVIVLNKKYHRLARYILLISAHVYIFITASTFGRGTGDHLSYLPILFGSVLVFDVTEKRSLIFSVLLTVSSLLLLEVTDYSLFHVSLPPDEQLNYYYGNLFTTFFCSIIIALFYFFLYAKQNINNEKLISTANEIEKTINYFSTSLYGKNTEDEILWDIAKNCIANLDFEDCVIYMLDEERNTLIQKAAYGSKNPKEYEIVNLIEIPLGQGIVGSVAQSGQAEIINDTTKDPRYIVDDDIRYSEITVPIIYNDKVIGIIDSEHSQKNYFNQSHLNILNTIAALCSNKIIKARAEDEKLKAMVTRLEAEKIKELDKVKSRFFVNISHEFRTPLTLILGPLEEMINKESIEEEKEQLKMMKSNAGKLLKLINDLLELARLDEGMLHLDASYEDIFSITRSTAAGFQALARQRDIQFQIHIPDDSLTMEFDVMKIETILMNLLSNAFKYTPAGGKVVINANQVNDRFEISVVNTGNEIPADLLEKIFDRFYQNDHKEYDGSGIGLALAKELAQLHEGDLTVKSCKEHGNCFTLKLPVKQAEQISKANKNSNNLATQVESRQKVNPFGTTERKPVALVVEDNDELRNYIIKILSEDFDVLKASDGKEGCDLAREELPDVVISDIMMPVMDGLDLCKNLKTEEITCHIPIILLTAKADLDSKLEGLEIGADYYLAKPFQPKELLTVSNNLVALRKKLKEQFSRTILLKTSAWEGASADERFLQKLMGAIEPHLSKHDFTVEQLQDELGISRMQLHRKLKALTDMSTTEFVRSVRLKRAAEMIEKGQDNVSQIAYQVGFSSLSYFTKSFKEQYGTPPSAYCSQKLSSKSTL